MATQPIKFSVQIGINANKVVIPESAGVDELDQLKLYPSAYELPLDAGGKAVGRTEMNTLFSMIFENLYFMQQGGVYEYSPSIDYTVGTRVLYQNNFYKCIQANGHLDPKDPTNSAYWDKFITLSELNSLLEILPSGIILPYGGVVAPNSFFMCDGSEKSRIAYPSLYTAIGTRYGAGDGSTTFNVPNLNNGSFPRGVSGANVGKSFAASLPPLTASSAGVHTHTKGTMRIQATLKSNGNEATVVEEQSTFTGAFKVLNQKQFNSAPTQGSHPGYDTLSFDTNYGGWSGATSENGSHTHTVTNSAGVAMNGTTVLPQSAGVSYIIKI